MPARDSVGRDLVNCLQPPSVRATPSPPMFHLLLFAQRHACVHWRTAWWPILDSQRLTGCCRRPLYLLCCLRCPVEHGRPQNHWAGWCPLPKLQVGPPERHPMSGRRWLGLGPAPSLPLASGPESHGSPNKSDRLFFLGNFWGRGCNTTSSLDQKVLARGSKL